MPNDNIEIEARILVLTVPYTKPETWDYLHRDGRIETFASRQDSDKDIIYYPREWSTDPDLGKFDYDPEDCLEVCPAGVVAEWLGTKNYPFHQDTRGLYIATRPVLNPDEQAEFREQFIDAHWAAVRARRASLKRRHRRYQLSK
jgi:hypothetical protein